MKEIKDVEIKLRNDEKRKKAYEEYQKYEKMLEIYENPASKNLLLRNKRNPFTANKKMEEKDGINAQEFNTFCERVDEIKKANPKRKLNDILTPEGRNVIGDIITQYNEKFILADLESVAVAKGFGLYQAVNEAQDKSNSEKLKILRDNDVTINRYEKACKDVEDYNRNNRGDLYDKQVKQGKPAQPIIHITAAVLKIGPGEAESSLSAYEVIESEKRQSLSDFDKKLNVSYSKYKSDYDLIEKAKCAIDKIIYADNLTDNQKELMIKEQRGIIERSEKRIKKANQEMQRVEKLEQNMKITQRDEEDRAV